MLIGALVAAALVLRSLFERLRLPPLLGYLLLGVGLRMMDDTLGLLPADTTPLLDFLGKLGVIALLLGVGMHSQLRRLLKELGRATPIFLVNLVLSGLIGAAGAWLAGLSGVSIVIVGVALSATSVGVATAVWDRHGVLDTEDGRLFLDVAELDDLAGVILLALLIPMLPDLRELLGGAGDSAAASGTDPGGAAGVPVWPTLTTAGLLLLKLGAFLAGCYLFARYFERPMARWLGRVEPRADAVITLGAVGAILAGIVGWLGFSVAIGAFFAGLALSRVRGVVEDQQVYHTLRDALIPFFFIDLGMRVSLAGVSDPWGLAWMAGVLAGAAIVGKVVGAMAPGWPLIGGRRSLVLGVSMVPRAEITMVIVAQGMRQGDWAVTGRLFTAMVLVVLVSSTLGPLVLDRLLAASGETGSGTRT